MSKKESRAVQQPETSVPDVSQPLASFQQVFEAELQQIAKRRHSLQQDSSESPQQVRRNLAGLCISGGGIRSACFAMGFTAALSKHGLFRVFDYLSTVSGGGYLGAYLSSWFARYPEKARQGQFPLPTDRLDDPQGRGVRNLIQGGDYIIDGPTAFNKYLIGLVLNKAAIVTLMLFIASMFAFTWRLLDTYTARDVLHLFDLDSDFVVPFLPSAVLATAWLVGWGIAYFRSGNAATGRIPGVMLILATAAFLIALALLFGNGDVRLPWSSNDDEPAAIPQHYWVPFVLVIAVLTALVPIIRPRRLLQSAVAPRNALDKWTFRAFSTAILAGLPLILIGLFGQEDYSGYFKFTERGLHEADIRIPSFVAEILRSSLPEADDPDFNPVEYLKTHGLPLHPSLDSSTQETPPKTAGTDASTSAEDSAALGDQFAALAALADLTQSLITLSPSSRSDLFTHPDVFDATPKQRASRKTLELFWNASGGITPHRQIKITEPQVTQGMQNIDAALGYLRFLALRIVLAHREEQAARNMFVRLDNHLIDKAPLQPGPSRWQWFSRDDYFAQCCRAVLYFVCDGSTEARQYVQARLAHRNLREQLANYLNVTLLTSREFAARLHKQAICLLDKSDELELDEQQISRLRDTIQLAARIQTGWGNRFEIASLNRDLLDCCFPGLLIPRDRVQRRVVIEMDQQARLLTALLALIATLTIGWFLDINLSSMHRYYRTRLGLAFIVPSKDSELPSLHTLDTTSVGAPYHLFGTCVSRFGENRSARLRSPTLASVHDTEHWDSRKQDIFLMSPLFVGSDATGGYLKTETYQQLTKDRCEQLDLGNVIALSGAAVSPALNDNPLLALLMFSLNLRLGQWLPNPMLPKPFTRPRFLYMLSNLWKPGRKRPYVFISDGGHVENLGLVQLLIRRCRLIVAIDSGHDPQHDFADLANALRLARVYHGIRIVQLTKDSDHEDAPVTEWNLGDLNLQRAGANDQSLLASALQLAGYPGNLLQTVSHFSAARILYPEHDAEGLQDNGLLILVKPSITGDESPDILQYRASSPAFPQEPTSELVFSPAQVESYRALGYHIGEQFCGWFGSPPGGPSLNQKYDTVSPTILKQAFESNYVESHLGNNNAHTLHTDESRFAGSKPR